MSRKNGQTEETTPALVGMHIPTSALGMPNKEAVETTAMASMVQYTQVLAQQCDKLIKHLSVSYEHMAIHVQNMHAMQTEYENQHRKNLKMQEKLLDKAEERKARRRKEDMHEKMLEKVISDMTALAPFILNKFAGGKALTESESVILQAFIGSLTKDELDGVLNSLDPAKRVVFQNMLSALPTEPRGPIMREGIECQPSSTPTEQSSKPNLKSKPSLDAKDASDLEKPRAD